MLLVLLLLVSLSCVPLLLQGVSRLVNIPVPPHTWFTAHANTAALAAAAYYSNTVHEYNCVCFCTFP